GGREGRSPTSSQSIPAGFRHISPAIRRRGTSRASSLSVPVAGADPAGGRGRANMLGLVLAVSVLLHLDMPDVVIFVDAGTRVENPEAFAAREACTALRQQGVPLPVPFTIQWFKRQGEGPGEVPDASRRVTGLLSKCAGPVAQQTP